MVRAGPGLTRGGWGWGWGWGSALAALAILALAPLAAPAQQPPPPAPLDADSADRVGDDPVGLLLEHKDSLGLSPDVVRELVQINLDLFRRTRRLQRSIDSILPPPPEPGFPSPRPRPLTPAQRDRLAPLLDERRQQLRRARDAAYALLTPEQRERARVLEQRSASRRRAARRP